MTFTCPSGTFAFRRMPFGLCNAPATFQRCILSVFSDMVGEDIEVFVDDFSISGRNFDDCLQKLGKVLKRCIECNLTLSWEKCHYMVKSGIVLGHVVSKRRIEVDPAKVEIIERLPTPCNVKGVRNFLGHVGFYRRFIKDFSLISHPLCQLLGKDVPFNFNDACLQAFETLKKKLISALIIVAPDWSLPFEIMTDASDHAVGAVLCQKMEKKLFVVYYASKSLNATEILLIALQMIPCTLIYLLWRKEDCFNFASNTIGRNPFCSRKELMESLEDVLRSRNNKIS